MSPRPQELPCLEAWMALGVQGNLEHEPTGQLVCAVTLNQPEHW